MKVQHRYAAHDDRLFAYAIGRYPLSYGKNVSKWLNKAKKMNNIHTKTNEEILKTKAMSDMVMSLNSERGMNKTLLSNIVDDEFNKKTTNNKFKRLIDYMNVENEDYNDDF